MPFTGLEELNLSGTGVDDIAALAGMKDLTKLDLSKNETITEADFGALIGLELEELNLSNTGVKVLGGLTDSTNEVNNVITGTLKSLDISGTGITQLEDCFWKWEDANDKTEGGEPWFPELTTLTAKDLKLNTIWGLVDMVQAEGFDADDLEWDFEDSVMETDAEDHVGLIEEAFANTTGKFTAPTVKNPVTYTVTVAQNLENGSVNVDKTTVARGETVTVTVTPDEGYKLDTLTVKDTAGEAVEVTEENTFTMPRGGVTVSATFTEASTEDGEEVEKTELDKAELQKEKFAEQLEKGKMIWNRLINAMYRYENAEAEIAALEEGEAKTAAEARLTVLTEYYAGITALDFSGDTTFAEWKEQGADSGALEIFTGLETLNLSGIGIQEVGALADKTKLTTLDLSDNTDIDDKDLGALVGLNLTTLDLSGTGITDIGGLTEDDKRNDVTVANKVKGTLVTLDISDTEVTKLESVYQNGAAAFTALKTLTATGLELESISGLADIAGAEGFAADVTWNLGGSTLATDENDHVGLIEKAFTNATGTFTPPTVCEAEEPTPDADTYKVTVATVTGGTITADVKEAKAGTTVTLTATVNSGYKFSAWKVTDAEGKTVPVTDNKFEMPAGDVTVSATFTKKSSGGSSSSGGGGGSSKPSTSNKTETTKNDDGSTTTTTTDKNGTEAVVRDVVVGEDGVTITVADGTTLKIVDNSKDFDDVNRGDWFKGAVDFASSHELFSGTFADTFTPNGDMTRGMLAVVLHNLANNPEAAAPADFTDVSNQYFADAVAWAAGEGIISGYGDDQFGANDNITREQLAVMLYRFAGSPGANGADLTNADADKVSGYAKVAMKWAVENGIISGDTDGNLMPQGNATRAQVASMLMRFCK